MNQGTVGTYYRLIEGPGEPRHLREELGKRANTGTGHPMLTFVHMTDIHILDSESPARVEFLDRHNDREGCEGLIFDAAFRPQEALALFVLESMIRQIRAVGAGPVTGAPFEFCICTGDNFDNQQFNELRWFIDMMDGGKPVATSSGSAEYEGVQSATWGDVEFWHPDPGVPDKYKQQWGFPDYPGLLQDMVQPVVGTGIGLPWLQTYGNHDGLVQGNFPRGIDWEQIAVGSLKPMGLPPGVNPCDAFETFMNNPAAIASAPMRPVAPDPARRIATRREYVEEMFKSTTGPPGHGFTEFNRRSGVAYWVDDSRPGFRFIGLDTVNPGGHDRGSIGAVQFTWLEERLKEVSSVHFDAAGGEVRTGNTDKVVILFSHHGLRSMDPIFINPDPADPSGSDTPRRDEQEIEPLIHRFPNVIAWINGHTHNNIVRARRMPGRRGFWDIGTASHVDWVQQSRLIEVVDNLDGTISIFGTMIDHAAPPQPGGVDPVLRLASISRELSGNDYQLGFDWSEVSVTGSTKAMGKPEDGNVELVITAPFRLSSHSSGPALAETR
ncbi:MAG TPA: TIGR03767 family metallophosphoesterase [Actinomycetota bacterium]|nr:TIGR03767 family metallophosphoesterase [Actinomycetota bacterium]